MKKSNMQINKAVLLLLSIMTVVGCDKKLSVDEPLSGSSGIFDYKIEVKKELSIDYRFPQKDYVVLFELYEECPLTVDKDGQTVKKELEPFYRAATDGSGKFKGEIMLLSSLSSVWIYSEYAGTLSPVEVPVTGNTIEFDLKKILAENTASRASSTRSATPNGKIYPDGWAVLGDWNGYGTPSNLEVERLLPPSSLLYKINEIFVKYNPTKLKDRYPQFFQDDNGADLNIIKKTKVYLNFINSTAQWNNVVGYFVYPTGQMPQKKEDVKRILAFPSVTPYMNMVAGKPTRGALVSGSRVQLKYWNNDTKQYEDEFPAGVSIGWWLEGNAFNTSNASIVPRAYNNKDVSRFSLDHLNDDLQRRSVSLLDNGGRIVAIGFEDNLDMRFNDATFYLETAEAGAIEPILPGIPDVGGMPSNEDNFYKKYGFVMFEDLWPSAGDYDLNDVIVQYHSTVYKQILNNRVYKIVDEYTPFHSGGSLVSGFGYQYPDLSNNEVYRVRIDGPTTSKFMEGQMLEPGQDRPTVILYDNNRAVLNKKFVVTTDFNDALENAVVPPYNPFIIVGADKKRTTEVHLVSYPATSKMDISLFGTKSDGSDISKGIYYVQKDNVKYPFSLNIPSVETMPISAEGVKIDVTFPKFKNWVESNGKQDADWFRHPAK